MRVLLTGGHLEYCHDVHAMYRRLGYDVWEPGGDGVTEAQERISLNDPRDPTDTEHWERIFGIIERGPDSWKAHYGSAHTDYFQRSPSLSEFVYDRAPGSVDHFVAGADFAHGLAAQYAAVFAPHMPFVYHFHGQTNLQSRVLVAKLRELNAHLVSYAESEAELLGMNVPVIHFGKDPSEWSGWTGDVSAALFMANHLLSRREACNYDVFERVRIPERWRLLGKGNEALGGGTASYHDMRELMRQYRLFFNLGTRPAPYTLGVIEAAMTGMPVVTPMYDYGVEHSRYMIPELLGDGCIVMKRPGAGKLAKLMSDSRRTRRKMERVGEASRAAAVHHFSNDTIDLQWRMSLRGYLGAGA